MRNLGFGGFVLVWFLAIPIGLVFLLLDHHWVAIGFFLLPAAVRILVFISDRFTNRSAKPS
jgi:hypothetical protein